MLRVSSVTVALSLALASSVGITGCASTEPWGPQQIDAVQRSCEAAAASGELGRLPKDAVASRALEPAGTPVTVYGAPWCKACRSTANYLSRRRIPFVEKDIDDMRTFDELHAVLAGARLRDTTAIPVVDVRGTVMVGFFPCALEGAWAAR